jgi:hypothetical protein
VKIDNYYLDLNKVSELKSAAEKDKIHSYYLDMMHCFLEKREYMGKSIFYTLYLAGYLKDVRDEKIKNLIHDTI